MKLKYNYILWDFNGTLYDDVDASMKSVNEMLSERQLPILDDVKRYRNVFGFPVEDYYKRVGFDFSAEPFSKLAHEWVEKYMKNSAKATLRRGVEPLLKRFRLANLKQVILSASESEMLKKQLDDLNISEYFDEICGCGDIYAAGKTEIAAQWREMHPHASAVLLGDTVQDAETADHIGIDCILVSGGHQKKSILHATGKPVCRTFGEVGKTILYTGDF